MRVLGIDPGTATSGYGLIDSTPAGDQAVVFGVITTPADAPLELRLLTIHTELTKLLLEFKPDACAVEALFFGRNTRSALSVAHGRGAALLAAAQNGLAVAVYTPIQVKQAVASYGAATKDQVQQMVRMLLRLESIPKPDDAADALAVAICHAHSDVANRRMAAAQAAAASR